MHVLARFPAIPASRTAALIERAARACELMLGYGALSESEIAEGIQVLRKQV
jgi:hypothetical protein